MRLFLGKGSDFWIISMSKFLNINDCSLFLEIIIYVLKNRFGFSDKDIEDFICEIEMKIDDNFEEVFND